MITDPFFGVGSLLQGRTRIDPRLSKPGQGYECRLVPAK